MSEGRKVGYICAGAAALALMLSLLILRGTSEGTPPLQNDYEEKLFDRSRVHEIDLEVEDWDLFLENAGKEEYRPCTIQIDGEKYAGAGIRVKGNNSRRLTEK